MVISGLLLVTVLALPHSVVALLISEPTAINSSEPHRGTSQGAAGRQERGLLRSAFRGWTGALAEGGGLAPDDDAGVVPGLQHEDPLKLSAQTNFVVNSQLTVTNLNQKSEVCTIVDVEVARVKIHCNTTTDELKEWLPKDSERIISEPERSGMLISSMHNMHSAMMQGSRAPKPDVLAISFSLLGGICMSIYPVPMKAPSVMKANVHPVFFQTYKSFWVFVTGMCFLVSNWLRGQSPVFNFSWLGVLSAAFWIPAGVCCITAVPRLGMGLTMTLLAGTAATMSFLVFWLVLGESMKVHHALGRPYYMAPLYLIGVIFFMALLVAVPRLELPGKTHPPLADDPPADGPPRSAGKEQTEEAKEETLDTPKFDTRMDLIVGYGAAFMAGACCTVQFGVVNVAKRYVLGSCAESPHECPPNIVERFDIFGSWMASFGIGALGISLVAVCMVWAIESSKGQPLSSFHWKVMMGPGNMAGMAWAAGNVFQLAALTRGGSAVMMPFNQACSLMLTGLWGLLYYKEVKGVFLSCLWLAVASCLVLTIIFLSHEKEG